MKTILIATDFSKAARHASFYGVQLAKAMGANIILFTAYEVSHDIASVNVQVSHYDAMMQTEQKLTDEAAVITVGEKLNLQTICAEGKAGKSILAIALEKKADLILAGTKDSGNHLKMVFGSTAIELIRDSVIPFLIVPEHARYIKPETILYASDIFLDITIQPIDQIQWITDFFKSKLYVVRVVNDEQEQLLEEVNVPQRLRTGLINIHTTFYFPVNKNVSNGLNEFMKTKATDMLVMTPHKYQWLNNLFEKSETKDMVLHSHIPVLILHDTAGKKSEPGTMINEEIVSAL